MSYRPEGLENPYPDLTPGWFGSDNQTAIEYYAKQAGWEAGADAMLDALKKDSAYSDGETPIIGFGAGYFFYLPEEKDKKLQY